MACTLSVAKWNEFSSALVHSFLNQCRPKSVSMGNAIKYVKMQISHIPQDATDNEVTYLAPLPTPLTSRSTSPRFYPLCFVVSQATYCSLALEKSSVSSLKQSWWVKIPCEWILEKDQSFVCLFFFVRWKPPSLTTPSCRHFLWSRSSAAHMMLNIVIDLVKGT